MLQNILSSYSLQLLIAVPSCSLFSSNHHFGLSGVLQSVVNRSSLRQCIWERMLAEIIGHALPGFCLFVLWSSEALVKKKPFWAKAGANTFTTYDTRWSSEAYYCIPAWEDFRVAVTSRPDRIKNSGQLKPNNSTIQKSWGQNIRVHRPSLKCVIWWFNTTKCTAWQQGKK